YIALRRDPQTAARQPVGEVGHQRAVGSDDEAQQRRLGPDGARRQAAAQRAFRRLCRRLVGRLRLVGDHRHRLGRQGDGSYRSAGVSAAGVSPAGVSAAGGGSAGDSASGYQWARAAMMMALASASLSSWLRRMPSLRSDNSSAARSARSSSVLMLASPKVTSMTG